MIRNRSCLILLLFNFLLCAKVHSQEKTAFRFPLIPKPTVLIPGKGEFELTKQTKIVFTKSNADVKRIADFLVYMVEKSSGYKLSFGKSIKKESVILFSVDSSIKNDEGYKLLIEPQSITIHFKYPKGAFLALQTLRQLMPSSIEKAKSGEKKYVIPVVSIEDAPRFSYRGFLLDVSRHFFSIDFLKRYIDLMAFYKYNVFHLHLNDDQGWRIEIKKYPRLQQISAWRKETQVGFRTDTPKKYDGIPHGGFYTQKELKELVKYAADRFVTIIPEIDFPGHSQAVLAAYPQLGCKDSVYTVSTSWGVHKDILCPKEETFRFLEDVLSEVLNIFPSHYIHIGGDEVPKDRWQESVFCQDMIRRLNFNGENGLQSYFIRRIEKFLNQKGRDIIGWDEILQGGLAPNATVMSWHGDKPAIESAVLKHNVIMTPSSFTYLNYYQTAKTSEVEPLANKGVLTLQKVYSYNPIPSGLKPGEDKYILGVQASLWTEYVPTEQNALLMAFPRACALAEVGWTSLKNKDYNDFTDRLSRNLLHLDKMGVGYAKYDQK
jgi:hexosaminidase